MHNNIEEEDNKTKDSMQTMENSSPSNKRVKLHDTRTEQRSWTITPWLKNSYPFPTTTAPNKQEEEKQPDAASLDAAKDTAVTKAKAAAPANPFHRVTAHQRIDAVDLEFVATLHSGMCCNVTETSHRLLTLSHVLFARLGISIDVRLDWSEVGREARKTSMGRFTEGKLMLCVSMNKNNPNQASAYGDVTVMVQMTRVDTNDITHQVVVALHHLAQLYDARHSKPRGDNVASFMVVFSVRLLFPILEERSLCIWKQILMAQEEVPNASVHTFSPLTNMECTHLHEQLQSDMLMHVAGGIVLGIPSIILRSMSSYWQKRLQAGFEEQKRGYIAETSAFTADIVFAVLWTMWTGRVYPIVDGWIWPQLRDFCVLLHAWCDPEQFQRLKHGLYPVLHHYACERQQEQQKQQQTLSSPSTSASSSSSSSVATGRTSTPVTLLHATCFGPPELTQDYAQPAQIKSLVSVGTRQPSSLWTPQHVVATSVPTASSLTKSDQWLDVLLLLRTFEFTDLLEMYHMKMSQ